MGCLDHDSTFKEHDRVRAAVDAIILSCIILGNSFIIFAILLNWKRQGISTRNKSSTLLIINLSVAGTFVGIINLYYFLPRYFCSLSDDLGNNFVACILSFSLVIMPYLASGYTLIAISVDRYLAVVYASSYDQRMNTRRSAAVIGLIWTVAIAASFLLFFWNNWEEGKDCTMINVFPLPLDFILGLLDILIFTIITVTLYYQMHKVTSHYRKNNVQPCKIQKQNAASASAMLIILVVYVVLWLPFTVLQIINKMGVAVPSQALEITSSLVNVNFLANPFIYALHHRPVRKAVTRTLGIFERGSPSTPVKHLQLLDTSVSKNSPMSYDELKQWPNNSSLINT